MLVLSRKADQTIRIGESIQLRIIQVQGGRVKIGIEAPDSVRILRGELETFEEECESEPEEEAVKHPRILSGDSSDICQPFPTPTSPAG